MLDWLDGPKFGDLAAGLVRVEAVDGSRKRWIEPEHTDRLPSSGEFRRA